MDVELAFTADYCARTSELLLQFLWPDLLTAYDSRRPLGGTSRTGEGTDDGRCRLRAGPLLIGDPAMRRAVRSAQAALTLAARYHDRQARKKATEYLHFYRAFLSSLAMVPRRTAERERGFLRALARLLECCIKRGSPGLGRARSTDTPRTRLLHLENGKVKLCRADCDSAQTLLEWNLSRVEDSPEGRAPGPDGCELLLSAGENLLLGCRACVYAARHVGPAPGRRTHRTGPATPPGRIRPHASTTTVICGF
jgi:hypothetical protein